MIDDYLACARVASTLLRSDEVRRRWDAPSALAQWTVAGLAGHLARSVLLLPGILATPVSEASPRTSAVDYFVTALPAAELLVTSATSAAIRERGVESAGPTAEDLLRRYDDTLTELAVTLPGLGPDHDVVALGLRLRLSEYLVTRMIELTVHSDDLAVSIGADLPEFSSPVRDVVVGALAEIAVRRHGFVEVLRGLARSERSAGDIAAF